MMFIILAFFLFIICPNVSAQGKPLVPCYYVFGDSLSDVGNNNNLVTAAKVNYAPYGIDFPQGATGRFSNGKNFVDALTELLGFKGYISPFSQAKGQELLKGVNYASGGAGIRTETSKHLGDRIWMDRQLQNHIATITKLQSILGKQVLAHLNQCLYTVNIGSNDYINNYFAPEHYPSKGLFNPDKYASQLISQYSLQLKGLYLTGARKIVVFGLGQIGCVPAMVLKYNTTQCVTEINEAVDIFNQKLGPTITQLNTLLPGAKFTFIDIATMQKATPPGGYIRNKSCCKLRSDYQCKPSVAPCADRKQYAFMDGFHPTEAVNVLTAGAVFKAPIFVSPANIAQLIST